MLSWNQIDFMTHPLKNTPQGEDVSNICKSDIKAAMQHVPKEGHNYCEGMLYAAEQAYDIRSGGRMMTLRQRKEKEPAGVEWDEDKVEEIYPAVAEYYSNQV